MSIALYRGFNIDAYAGWVTITRLKVNNPNWSGNDVFYDGKGTMDSAKRMIDDHTLHADQVSLGRAGDSKWESIREDTMDNRGVLSAFSDQSPGESRQLSTDGQVLDGKWMGGKNIAFWGGDGRVHFNNLGSKAGDDVQRALRKLIPRSDLAEGLLREGLRLLTNSARLEIEGSGNTFSLWAYEHGQKAQLFWSTREHEVKRALEVVQGIFDQYEDHHPGHGTNGEYDIQVAALAKFLDNGGESEDFFESTTTANVCIAPGADAYEDDEEDEEPKEGNNMKTSTKRLIESVARGGSARAQVRRFLAVRLGEAGDADAIDDAGKGGNGKDPLTNKLGQVANGSTGAAASGLNSGPGTSTLVTGDGRSAPETRSLDSDDVLGANSDTEAGARLKRSGDDKDGEFMESDQRFRRRVRGHVSEAVSRLLGEEGGDDSEEEEDDEETMPWEKKKESDDDPEDDPKDDKKESIRRLRSRLARVVEEDTEDPEDDDEEDPDLEEDDEEEEGDPDPEDSEEDGKKETRRRRGRRVSEEDTEDPEDDDEEDPDLEEDDEEEEGDPDPEDSEEDGKKESKRRAERLVRRTRRESRRPKADGGRSGRSGLASRRRSVKEENTMDRQYQIGARVKWKGKEGTVTVQNPGAGGYTYVVELVGAGTTLARHEDLRLVTKNPATH